MSRRVSWLAGTAAETRGEPAKGRRSIWVAAAIAVALALGCRGESKPTAPESSATSAPSQGAPSATPATSATSAAGPALTGPPVRLCIDPDDLEVEPLDLDDLAGETPLRDVSAPLPGVVTRGQAVALSAADDAHDAVPVIACDAAACNGAVLVVDRAGKEIARATLPDLAGLPRGTAVEFSVALADVDGDGASELWVGAEVSERAQKTPGTAPAQTPAQTPAKKPAKPRIRRTVLAVFATPDLTLQWSAEIAHQRPGDACEGALYSVDADCDGGGDLLLSRRCGPPGCLGDDGADVDGVPVQREACRDTLAVYIWNPARRSYDARAVQPPSSAGSKP